MSDEPESRPRYAKTDLGAYARAVRAARRRKAWRIFWAFLVIVAYGGLMAHWDFSTARHPTGLTWAWAGFLGFLVLALLVGLLSDDVRDDD